MADEIRNVFGDPIAPPGGAVVADAADAATIAKMITPAVPKVDHPPETPEEVQSLATAFAEYRKEVAALREEIAASRKGVRTLTVVAEETPEERQQKRLAAILEHSHYCPGCGQLYNYPRECEGTAEGPHKPIDVVSTDELHGDPAYHTPAPDTEELAA